MPWQRSVPMVWDWIFQRRSAQHIRAGCHCWWKMVKEETGGRNVREAEEFNCRETQDFSLNWDCKTAADWEWITEIWLEINASIRQHSKEITGRHFQVMLETVRSANRNSRLPPFRLDSSQFKDLKQIQLRESPTANSKWLACFNNDSKWLWAWRRVAEFNAVMNNNTNNTSVEHCFN